MAVLYIPICFICKIYFTIYTGETNINDTHLLTDNNSIYGKVTPMSLVIALVHLVTALTCSIQIMFESCLMVFTDLERIEFDESKFNIQQTSKLDRY